MTVRVSEKIFLFLKKIHVAVLILSPLYKYDCCLALESNIYQLSKSLSEQKAVIKNLMELCGHEKEKTRESNLNHASIHQQKEMQCLMQKIDGIAVFFAFIISRVGL